MSQVKGLGLQHVLRIAGMSGSPKALSRDASGSRVYLRLGMIDTLGFMVVSTLQGPEMDCTNVYLAVIAEPHEKEPYFLEALIPINHYRTLFRPLHLPQSSPSDSLFLGQYPNTLYNPSITLIKLKITLTLNK